jgi:hypothetical protein
MDGKKTVTANFQTTPVLTSIVVSPASISVTTGGTQQFTAVACDQNSNPLSPQPSLVQTVTDNATIEGIEIIRR